MSKNKVGRPRLYDNPEKLKEKIDEYFKSIEYEEEGKKKTRPPLIGGLALFCGFSSVKRLHEYEQEEGFSEIVKAGKLKCGNILNEMGLMKEIEPRLTLLNLSSNHGLSEKQKIEHTGKDGKPIQIESETLNMLNEYRNKRDT